MLLLTVMSLSSVQAMNYIPVMLKLFIVFPPCKNASGKGLPEAFAYVFSYLQRGTLRTVLPADLHPVDAAALRLALVPVKDSIVSSRGTGWNTF